MIKVILISFLAFGDLSKLDKTVNTIAIGPNVWVKDSFTFVLGSDKREAIRVDRYGNLFHFGKKLATSPYLKCWMNADWETGDRS